MTSGAQFEYLTLGSDYAGFTIYFYEAGTTTGKDVWVDEGKSTAVQQIRADSKGTATWYADGMYRVKILDADGVLLYDWDNVRANTYISHTNPSTLYSTLNEAISTIGSDETDLYITQQIIMDANLVVPSNIRLHIIKGGSIDQKTYTLTINGQIDAGLYQIFDGTGTITFGSGSVNEVYPQWWGAKGDEVTDDTTAFQNAITAALAANTKVSFVGTYAVNLLLNENYINLSGINPRKSILVAYNTASPIIQTGNNTKNISGLYLKNLTIDGKNTSDLGLFISGGSIDSHYDNIVIKSFSSTAYGLKIMDTSYPIMYQYFNGLTVDYASVYMKDSNNASTWTTTIFMNNIKMRGTTGQYLLENDGVSSLYINNGEIEPTGPYGIKFTKSNTTYPYMYLSNTTIEPLTGTNVLIEIYNNSTVLSDFIKGTYLIDGIVKKLDTTTYTVSGYGYGSFETMFSYPGIYGEIRFSTTGEYPASPVFKLWTDGTDGVLESTGTLFLTTQSGIQLYDGVGSIKIFQGLGSPEGVVSAGLGGMYLNRSGGAGTTLYIKESGSGNTGWIAK